MSVKSLITMFAHPEVQSAGKITGRRGLITMLRFGTRVLCLALLWFAAHSAARAASEFSGPWYGSNSSIVVDAYEYTPINWNKLRENTRLIGFVNKASDGLPPTASCRGSDKYCRLAWRRYSIAKELYHTRKSLAKQMGMKWGAYHLARPGNPIRQALHFLSFARPEKDDLIALDIEDNDPKKWMSLKDAERFSRVIYRRLGRYPLLYTNHSTAKFIAQNKKKYPILARMNLWYARYRSEVQGAFPMGNWDSYTMWQFSTQVNCNRKRCLRRMKGVDHRIDVNVIAMRPDAARKAWPFSELTARKPEPGPLAVPSPNPLVAAAKQLLPAKVPVLPAKPVETEGSPVVAGVLPLVQPSPDRTQEPDVPGNLRAVSTLVTAYLGAGSAMVGPGQVAERISLVDNDATTRTAKASLPKLRPGAAFPLPSSAPLPSWRPGSMITVRSIRPAQKADKDVGVEIQTSTGAS